MSQFIKQRSIAKHSIACSCKWGVSRVESGLNCTLSSLLARPALGFGPQFASGLGRNRATCMRERDKAAQSISMPLPQDRHQSMHIRSQSSSPPNMQCDTLALGDPLVIIRRMQCIAVELQAVTLASFAALEEPLTREKLALSCGCLASSLPG
jgi:hypothetical protein